MSHTNNQPFASLEPIARAFYQETMTALNEAGIPYLIGGAYSLERYTGIARHTKDLDVFARPGDCPRILDRCARRGDTVDLLFPHWLAKVYRGEFFIDVIFSSGNGVAEVDDQWFARARRGTVLGVDVLLCPPEETIWSKAFIMERERFDGADVAHLFRACAADMDWAQAPAFPPSWPPRPPNSHGIWRKPLMHERSLLRGLMAQIEALARQHAAVRVTVVRLKLGPLAQIEPDHLREHFVEAAVDTVAEGARLDIETTDDLHELTLVSIDVQSDK